MTCNTVLHRLAKRVQHLTGLPVASQINAQDDVRQMSESDTHLSGSRDKINTTDIK